MARLLTRDSHLHAFRKCHVGAAEPTTAVSLDALYLMKNFSREIACTAIRTTDNRNIFDHQKTCGLPVASRHVPEMNSIPTAVLAASLSCQGSAHSNARSLRGGLPCETGRENKNMDYSG